MENNHSSLRPDIWGGIECTINRVGDRYADQLEIAGHYDRAGDIYQIAGLGLKTIRYPILWERHVDARGHDIDWSWADRQLSAFKKLEVNVIAGLVHHGSGPSFTDLLDPGFAIELSRYAAKVASRFPWISRYTIINEPLTTARFSGLYGLWYPHAKDEASFLRMLINQVKATVLSMQEIRKINPGAQLVQTEDLTFIHSTPPLKAQAKYENERRWLSYDLLCGYVNKDHYFWHYLLNAGVSENELKFFVNNACPPQIMGFNYYITSERYLDHSLEKYHPDLHGGNGWQSYADTEAIQAGKQKGLKKLLTEAWNRYQLPLAVTECHIGCTPDEQIRWFRQNFQDCCELCKTGINITAITAWSLLGAYNWNNLLTSNTGLYEAGAFEISDNEVIMTPLAEMLQSLINDDDSYHWLNPEDAWWQQRLYPA